MVANSVKRQQYGDLIISLAGPRCDYSNAATVLVPAGGAFGDRVVLRVNPVARQAFRALAAVMLHYGYAFVETAGGTLNCRYIGGTRVTSFHAHGIAGDWNPSKNRYRVVSGPIQWGRHTDMPIAMVRAIESIRSASGHPVFEWGGRWSNTKDPMHYELDILRSRLVTGINLNTLPAGAWSKYLMFEGGATPPTQGDEFDMLRPCKLGDRGDHVEALQIMLHSAGFGNLVGDIDGVYGAMTSAGLLAARKSVGSNSSNGGYFDGHAYDQLHRAHTKATIGAGGTVDSSARSQAAAARGIAEDAKAAATRANKTLDKIRSE